MSQVTYVPLKLDDPELLYTAAGKRPLVGMTLKEIEDLMAELGEAKFRARQLFQWVYARGVKSFAAMTNLSRELRSKLEERTLLLLLEQDVAQEADPTATTKYLFRMYDGQKVEAVLMRHAYGNSVCLTTQVGCRMGCTFCASTFGGLVRNLTAGEIADQLIMMQRDLPEGERVGHVVLMGSGEPLENYEHVVKAIRLLHEPDGLNIGYRHITLSTSGLVPGMQRLAEEGLPITLALSLHAPTDELRQQLMPVARMWPLSEVLEAASQYAEKTGRRVTYEYILIEGVNDNPQQARELGRLLKGTLAHVNLIPMNPVAERPQFRRPGSERISAFREILEQVGINTTVRREMGGDIDAACGQLRNRVARQRGAVRSGTQ